MNSYYEEIPGSGTEGTTSRFCPNGHEIKDPNLRFCPFCGEDLPEAGGGFSEEKPETGKTVEKICDNGHVYSDPELAFCPECGLPLRVRGPVPSPEENPIPVKKEKPEKTLTEKLIEEGMRPPTEGDLERK